MQFSANLGFLWQELDLPDAIRAAKIAGFDAVECHWPYDVPTSEVNEALKQTNLKMLGINTIRGDTNKGENGLAALPDRETEARAAIDQALDYAIAIHTPNIHIMAGTAKGETAHQTYIANLTYATNIAKQYGITILIEPLNRYDAPGYFLNSTAQARTIIDQVNVDNLKLMFDCYHVQIIEGNITRKLQELLSYIGHIQFASVPNRSAPDQGELNYDHIFKFLDKLGYAKPLGAEYRPQTTTESSLAWLKLFQS